MKVASCGNPGVSVMIECRLLLLLCLLALKSVIAVHWRYACRSKTSSMIQCPVRHQLFVDTGMVQPARGCSSQRMVSFVSSCLLEMLGDCCIEHIVTMFKMDHWYVCSSFSSRLQIKLTGISRTKVTIFFKKPHKASLWVFHISMVLHNFLLYFFKSPP